MKRHGHVDVQLVQKIFTFLAFVKPDFTLFQCVTQITEKTLDGQGNVIDSKTTKITKAAPEEVIPATTTQPIESIQSDPTLITEKTIEKDASETKVQSTLGFETTLRQRGRGF